MGPKVRRRCRLAMVLGLAFDFKIGEKFLAWKYAGKTKVLLL